MSNRQGELTAHLINERVYLCLSKDCTSFHAKLRILLIHHVYFLCALQPHTFFRIKTGQAEIDKKTGSNCEVVGTCTNSFSSWLPWVLKTNTESIQC